jgi:hypothetical protein
VNEAERKIIIDKLREIWEQNPEMELTQILDCASLYLSIYEYELAGKKEEEDLWMTDADLFRWLDENT